MSIINQPRVINTGRVLCDCLTNNPTCEGSTFYIVSAYAKRAGINRIQSSIEQFRQRGGSVIGIIGIDQQITTIQALQKLKDITDELYVYHSENLTQTFHPKIYVIENTTCSCVVFIGSSNLTSGGLFTNYEATYQKVYNLQCDEDSNEFSSIKQMIESYKDTSSPCCKLVTDDLLTQLVRQNYLANEQVIINITRPRVSDSGADEEEPIFGTERFTEPPVETTPTPIIEYDTTNVGFWKKLSSNDVSRRGSPGQIIIPKKFRSLFPTLPVPETTPANASQAEAFFNVIFISSLRERIRIDGVRFVYYVPAPTHPRQNTEFRFTFRNREILNQLEAGDILEFKRTSNPDIWFQIRLIKPNSSVYRRLSAHGRWDFITS